MIVFTSEIIKGLTEKLKEKLPGFSNYRLENIHQITGGADTLIYSFDFSFHKNEEKELIHLVARIFREGTSDRRAENEYNILELLYKNNLSVPKQYTYGTSKSPLSLPYILMENVKGRLLWEVLVNSENPNNLFLKFVIEMIKIHNLDWKKAFSQLYIPNIEEDPFILITNALRHPKELISRFNLNELKPLISWLENNKVLCKKLSLVHGDYHPLNVIVKPNGEFVVIDWSNVMISDFRIDLGFSIGVINTASPVDVKIPLVQMYEKISSEKIENIDYFIIISHFHNLLRMYSCVFNPEITNEDDNTINTMINQHRPYVHYLIKITKEITGISLSELQNAINQLYD